MFFRKFNIETKEKYTFKSSGDKCKVEYYHDKMKFSYNIKNNDKRYFIIGSAPNFETPTDEEGFDIEGDKTSIFDIKGKFYSTRTSNINVYILLYSNKTLIDKKSFEMDDFPVTIQTPENAESFRIAIRISGEGSFELENIQMNTYESLRNQTIFIRNALNVDKMESISSNIRSFIPGPINKNYERSTLAFIEGSMYIKDEFEMSITDDFWKKTASISRSNQRLIHSHSILSDIIKQYQVNGDTKLIHSAYNHISKWIKFSKTLESEKTLAWHDETTARRVFQWINYIDSAKYILEKKKISYLIEEMIIHAERLSDSQFHSSLTNHGMFQDIALLVYSDYFSQVLIDKFYYELSQKRLQKYFNFIISEEGVHLEHSPAYHEVIAQNLKRVTNYFSLIGDPISNKLMKKYNIMSKFATHIIMPNGYLPHIGDTQPQKANKQLWTDNPFYQYSVSSGKNGLKPENCDVVYPESGYAIFRKTWDYNDSNTYVLFTAAYHTAYHKHSDDLSFMLYHDGELFSEAGPNGYNYKDPFTQYGYSSFAHNTLVVDGDGLPRVDNKFDKTYINNYSLDNENNLMVSGINNRFNDIQHQRTINYKKSDDIVKVIDRVTSTNEHNYKLLYHLATDIQIETKGECIILLRSNTKVAELKFSTDTKISINYLKGIESPVNGWRFLKMGNKIENYVICVESCSEELNLSLEIRLF